MCPISKHSYLHCRIFDQWGCPARCVSWPQCLGKVRV